jgi:D-3-phosphoglycerate dehydrogenase
VVYFLRGHLRFGAGELQHEFSTTREGETMNRSTQGARALFTAPHWNWVEGEHRRLLEASGLIATITDHDITREEQFELIRTVKPEVAIIGDDVWDEEAFRLAKSLGLICVSRHGTGVHPTMKEGAERAGIGLANTPGTTETPVSELTVGLILAALRQIPARNAEMASGTWKRIPGQEVRGSKVLIFGSGFIGTATARLLVPFGADITLLSRKLDDRTSVLLAAHRALKTGMLPAIGERYGTLSWRPATERAAALADADVVVLLVPMTAETTGIVDADFLAAMKPGATLVSVSRGGLIKSEAEVVAALRAGTLGAFATDVYQNEPIRSPGDSAYLGAPDVANRIVCLPHVGWLTRQNIVRQLSAALRNVIAGYTGHPEQAMNWVVPIPA